MFDRWGDKTGAPPGKVVRNHIARFPQHESILLRIPDRIFRRVSKTRVWACRTPCTARRFSESSIWHLAGLTGSIKAASFQVDSL